MGHRRSADGKYCEPCKNSKCGKRCSKCPCFGGDCVPNCPKPLHRVATKCNGARRTCVPCKPVTFRLACKYSCGRNTCVPVYQCHQKCCC